MLDIDSEIQTLLNRAGIKTHWILKCNSNAKDGDASTIWYFSDKDYFYVLDNGVTKRVYGNILNIGSIQSAIDYHNFKGKSPSISITFSNSKSIYLSAEQRMSDLLGSYFFTNRTCELYLYVEGLQGAYDINTHAAAGSALRYSLRWGKISANTEESFQVTFFDSSQNWHKDLDFSQFRVVYGDFTVDMLGDFSSPSHPAEGDPDQGGSSQGTYISGGGLAWLDLVPTERVTKPLFASSEQNKHTYYKIADHPLFEVMSVWGFDSALNSFVKLRHIEYEIVKADLNNDGTDETYILFSPVTGTTNGRFYYFVFPASVTTGGGKWDNAINTFDKRTITNSNIVVQDPQGTNLYTLQHHWEEFNTSYLSGKVGGDEPSGLLTSVQYLAKPFGGAGFIEGDTTEYFHYNHGGVHQQDLTTGTFGGAAAQWSTLEDTQTESLILGMSGGSPSSIQVREFNNSGSGAGQDNQLTCYVNEIRLKIEYEPADFLPLFCAVKGKYDNSSNSISDAAEVCVDIISTAALGIDAKSVINSTSWNNVLSGRGRSVRMLLDKKINSRELLNKISKRATFTFYHDINNQEIYATFGHENGAVPEANIDFTIREEHEGKFILSKTATDKIINDITVRYQQNTGGAYEKTTTASFSASQTQYNTASDSNLGTRIIDTDAGRSLTDFAANTIKNYLCTSATAAFLSREADIVTFITEDEKLLKLQIADIIAFDSTYYDTVLKIDGASWSTMKFALFEKTHNNHKLTFKFLRLYKE